MASNQQDIRYQAGKTLGHAQEKTDDMKDKASDKAQEAGNFLQQTGDQVKAMAQGAADAVKNTLGMGEQNTEDYDDIFEDEDDDLGGELSGGGVAVQLGAMDDTDSDDCDDLEDVGSQLIKIIALDDAYVEMDFFCVMLIDRASLTGDQVKAMAQGAADAVKNTLGMGEQNTGSSTSSTTTTTRK
ncbi:late embryogenesis abundant protein 7-like [Aristolochia californica]|uniref:late embryogenesis abundant protein 7-like n=1 Tax=Aristolochia californica TaxID=171875 RepID=UPI0035DD03F5